MVSKSDIHDKSLDENKKENSFKNKMFDQQNLSKKEIREKSFSKCFLNRKDNSK